MEKFASYAVLSETQEYLQPFNNMEDASARCIALNMAVKPDYRDFRVVTLVQAIWGDSGNEYLR